MPTKLNKAGQEQNYVPAGNGDASGEYGDNATGSNIHFTNFKKPESAIDETKKEKVETESKSFTTFDKKEEQKQENKELEIPDYINDAMKKDYANFLDYDFSDEQIKKRLTEHLLNGDYGRFERKPEDMGKGYDDYMPLVEEWMNKNKPQTYYYKRKGKWVSTRNAALVEWLNDKFYTEEEYKAKILADSKKSLKQSDYDVKITENFGEDCQVAFGKGYSKEYMDQIVESSKIIATDFPDMKGFIKGIGDRNSLRKLSEARTQLLLNDENYVNDLAKSYLDKNPNISMETALRKARNEIENNTLNISNAGGRTLAFWQPGQRCLVMLPKTANDNANENQIRYFQQNWHSSDKPMATYYHEFGHAIDSMMAHKYKKLVDREGIDHETRLKLMEAKQLFTNEIENYARENYSKEYNERFLGIVNKKLGTDYKSMSEFNQSYSRDKYIASTEAKETLEKENFKKYNVSEYGNTNTQEFIAECFSAYYTGMKNPLADKVVKRMMQYYNELGAWLWIGRKNIKM